MQLHHITKRFSLTAGENMNLSENVVKNSQCSIVPEHFYDDQPDDYPSEMEELNNAMCQDEDDQKSYVSEESIYLTWHTTPASSQHESSIASVEKSIEDSEHSDVQSEDDESTDILQPFPEMGPVCAPVRRYSLSSQNLNSSVPLNDLEELCEQLYEENRPQQRQDSMYCGFINSQPSQSIKLDSTSLDLIAPLPSIFAKHIVSGNGAFNGAQPKNPVENLFINSGVGDKNVHQLQDRSVIIGERIPASYDVMSSVLLNGGIASPFLKLTPIQPSVQDLPNPPIHSTPPFDSSSMLKTKIPILSAACLSANDDVKASCRTPSPMELLKPVRKAVTSISKARDIFHSIDPELLAAGRSTSTVPRKRRGGSRLDRWPSVRKRGSIFLPDRKS